MPGCEAMGEYRAPKSRRNLKDYWWFCLEHVRAYNSTWDYYKGMSPGEIEAQLRADTAWQRPSWPLGRLGTTAAWDEELLRDPLHLLAAGRVKRGSAQPPQQTPPELREPLATLGLSLADHAGRGEDALQGTGEAPPSGRQWRRPRRRGTTEDDQPGLRRTALAPGARAQRGGRGVIAAALAPA